jgi:hypothetical protein
MLWFAIAKTPVGVGHLAQMLDFTFCASDLLWNVIASHDRLDATVAAHGRLILVLADH